MSRHRSSRSSTEIGGKPRTPRQLRVGEELRHALAAVFERGDMRDPDLRDASITVTEVDVSPDLRNATAFVMPLGGADRERLLAAMRRAAPYFRAQLARAVELRHAPDLRFELDKGYDHAQRIDALLRATAPPRDPGAAPEDADS